MISTESRRKIRIGSCRLPMGFAVAVFLCSIPGRSQVITSTIFEGPSSDPSVIVEGSGFGSAPVADPVGQGLTGVDFAGGQFFFNDDFSPPWQGGYPGNSLGLVLSSYTPTQVIFGFGSALTGSIPAYSLNANDPYRISVNGVTFNGTVNFSSSPIITATTIEGPSSNPTVIVQGFNFGSAPAADPLGPALTGADFEGGGFYFVDDTASWQGGFPGNSLGLNLLSYTPTEATFGFGSALTGSDPAYSVNEGDLYQVSVNGALLNGTVDFTPEPRTWVLVVLGSIALVLSYRSPFASS